MMDTLKIVKCVFAVTEDGNVSHGGIRRPRLLILTPDSINDVREWMSLIRSGNAFPAISDISAEGATDESSQTPSIGRIVSPFESVAGGEKPTE